MGNLASALSSELPNAPSQIRAVMMAMANGRPCLRTLKADNRPDQILMEANGAYLFNGLYQIVQNLFLPKLTIGDAKSIRSGLMGSDL